MSHSHVVKGNWGSAVKTSADYNWRNTIPTSNCNGGLISIRTDHPLKNTKDEDAENSSKQGRNLQEEGLDEMIRSLMKDKLEDFETLTQGKTSGEADISPEGLEAAETLAKVLTQRTKTYTRKVKTGLRRKLDADEVSTGEGINTCFTDVNTAFKEIKSGDDEVNSGDESIIPSLMKSQREGKAMLEEDSQSKRTKKRSEKSKLVWQK
ncbi:hypothetical protein Tco_1189284 [Tanacetum coccineum]